MASCSASFLDLPNSSTPISHVKSASFFGGRDALPRVRKSFPISVAKRHRILARHTVPGKLSRKIILPLFLERGEGRDDESKSLANQPLAVATNAFQLFIDDKRDVVVIGLGCTRNLHLATIVREVFADTVDDVTLRLFLVS